ncbi:MAG: branched-chain amino acid ABC transporter permease [Pseudomonadota bacterium]
MSSFTFYRNYRLTYLEDRSLFHGFQNFWTRAWLLLGALALIALPQFLPQYWVYTLNLAAIAVIGALGLNVLTGSAGQISLAHASVLAIGAYATAWLAKKGVPFIVVIPAAGAIAALVGCLISLPALRLKGLYLALATLSFFVIVDFAIRKAGFLTGGASGTHVPPPAMFGWTLAGDKSFYYLFVALATLCALFVANLNRTWVGRSLMAVRDSDIAAEMAGISVFRTKLLAFAISSFLGGMAGSLMGYYLQFINPDNFGLSVSVAYIAMIIVGGMGSVTGSILGAVFMTLLPEVLRVSVHALSKVMPALDVASKGAFVEGAVYGLVIILFLMFKPEGLARFWRDTLTYFRTWPFGH